MLTILQKPEQTKYMYMFNKEGQFFFFSEYRTTVLKRIKYFIIYCNLIMTEPILIVLNFQGK